MAPMLLSVPAQWPLISTASTAPTKRGLPRTAPRMVRVGAAEYDASVWPEDPDVVPDWVADVETRRRDAGIVPWQIPCRTRSDVERAIAAIHIADAAAPAASASHVDAAIETPASAARALRDWIVSSGLSGLYSDKELSALTRLHARECGVVACHDNQIRRHMIRLPGVDKRQVPSYDARGKRFRNFRWIIASTDADAQALWDAAQSGQHGHAQTVPATKVAA